MSPDLPTESYEIPRPELGLPTPGRNGDELVQAAGNRQVAPPIFQPGDIVLAGDRSNTGEIVAVGEQVQVRFVSRLDGIVSEYWFSPNELTLRKRASTQPTISVLSYSELMTLPAPEWLIKGIVNRAELVVLYGASGSGKTFLAIDIALSIASGREWCDRPVAKGVVLYVVGEGLFGMPKRLQAWARDCFVDVGPNLEVNFKAIGRAIRFLDTDFELLIEVVRELEVPPALIIIDTLALCMAGGDENSAKDMGVFVEACNRLRGEFGSAVLVIHHTGKGDSTIERGSSALRGAADTMILVAPDNETNVIVSCSKQKEAEPFKNLKFELEKVYLDSTPEGDVVTSCRLSLISIRSTETGAVHVDMTVGDNSLKLLETLKESFMDDTGATGPQLIAVSKVPKSSAYRDLKKLLTDKMVVRERRRGIDYYRLPPPAEVSPVSDSLNESQADLRQEGSTESQIPTGPTPLKGVGRGNGTETGNTTDGVKNPRTAQPPLPQRKVSRAVRRKKAKRKGGKPIPLPKGKVPRAEVRKRSKQKRGRANKGGKPKPGSREDAS